MRVRDLQFKGFFQESASPVAEDLQIMVPENDLEKEMLRWAILPHGETVEIDNARWGYVFHYELGEYIDEGMYVLKVSCRDASGVSGAIEIAAALVASAGTFRPGPHAGFVPVWFISREIRFKPLDERLGEEYHRPAFGRLQFGGVGNLPHRRIFGATV